jgi:hypothetical protein
MNAIATISRPSISLKLCLLAGLLAGGLSLSIGHVRAAELPGPVSLASTDQTGYLTAVKESALPSEDADYTIVLNDNGLFVSVTTGSITFQLQDSVTMTLDQGDVAVVTGDAARGSYIEMLSGSAEVSTGLADTAPQFVTTSLGIATARANADDAEIAAINADLADQATEAVAPIGE